MRTGIKVGISIAAVIGVVGIVISPLIIELASKSNTRGCDPVVVDLVLDKVTDKYRKVYAPGLNAGPNGKKLTVAELDDLETTLKCDRKWVDDLPKDKYDRCVKAAYYRWLDVYFRAVTKGREEIKNGVTKPEWEKTHEAYLQRQYELSLLNALGKVPDPPPAKECVK